MQAGQEIRESMLQDMTVNDVYCKFAMETEHGMNSFLKALRGPIEDRVVEYFAAFKCTVEDRLDAVNMKTINLSGSQEVARFIRYPDRHRHLDNH